MPETLTIWLADKILDVVANEDEITSEAIAYAQNKINAEEIPSTDKYSTENHLQ